MHTFFCEVLSWRVLFQEAEVSIICFGSPYIRRPQDNIIVRLTTGSNTRKLKLQRQLTLCDDLIQCNRFTKIVENADDSCNCLGVYTNISLIGRGAAFRNFFHTLFINRTCYISLSECR